MASVAERVMAMETLKAVAHPWLCDAMGHMNVQHYTAIFDDASAHFFGAIGAGVKPPLTELGWADVHHEVEFKDEVTSGDLLTVRSHVVKVGRASLTFRHVMTGRNEGVHAII